MKKLMIIFSVIMLCFVCLANARTIEDTLPITTNKNPGPVLDVEIEPYFGIFFVLIRVENIGNETAHNVTLVETSFEGNIIYNSRDMLIDPEIPPGDDGFNGAGIFLGLGKFTVTITVTCDEEISATGSANGFALGILCYIP